jgi:trehalose 6-phosphate phosphatase
MSAASELRAGFPDVDFEQNALFLDIDGTIIDIAPTPEAVVVPESLKLSLTRLCEELGGALALVSGRTLSAIDELFAPMKFTAAGAHGAELRFDPRGAVERRAIPLTATEKAVFADLSKLDSRLRIEDKLYTLAVHYRAVPELESKIIAEVRERAQKLREDLRVLCGKYVVEVKTPGFNKGTAIQHIMEHPPFAGRRPIFFGDDITDEDGFAVLPPLSGVGISVGRLMPGAIGCVPSASAVRDWLAHLAGLHQSV